MGMLARLAQAAYLLGRVLRHTLETTTDQDFQARESQQLDRTLRALNNLMGVEGKIRRFPVCAQTAICYRYDSSFYSIKVTTMPQEHPGQQVRNNNVAL